MISFFALTVVVVLVATTSQAYAYIDPGSGSYAFQLLASFFIVGLFFVKNSIKRLFKKIVHLVKH